MVFGRFFMLWGETCENEEVRGGLQSAGE